MSVQREVNALYALNGISDDVPGWSRETPRRFWDPSRKLLLATAVSILPRSKRNGSSLFSEVVGSASSFLDGCGPLLGERDRNHVFGLGTIARSRKSKRRARDQPACRVHN